MVKKKYRSSRRAKDVCIGLVCLIVAIIALIVGAHIPPADASEISIELLQAETDSVTVSHSS